MSLFRNTDGRDPFANYDAWKTTDTEYERRCEEDAAFERWLESDASDTYRRWTTNCCGAEWEWHPKIGETCEACDRVIHDGTEIKVIEPTDDDWANYCRDAYDGPDEPEDRDDH